MVEFIQTRWRVAKEIWRRPVVQVPVTIWLLLWAACSTYSTVIDQLVPPETSKTWPKTYQVLGMIGDFMPVWGWPLGLAIILALGSIEVAVKARRKGARVPAVDEDKSPPPASSQTESLLTPYEVIRYIVDFSDWNRGGIARGESGIDEDGIEVSRETAALNAIEERLGIGSILALGIPSGGDVHKTISASYWRGSCLEPLAALHPGKCSTCAKPDFGHPPRYDDVRFVPDEVHAIWPLFHDEYIPLRQAAQTSFDETNEGISERVGALLDDISDPKNPETRLRYHYEALKLIEDVSMKGVQLPGVKVSGIPTDFIRHSDVSHDGVSMTSRDGRGTTYTNVVIRKTDLDRYISERHRVIKEQRNVTR